MSLKSMLCNARRSPRSAMHGEAHALQCKEKPTLCNARRSPRSAMQGEAHALQCKEKPTLCNARRSPHAATTERPHSATKTQGSQKKKAQADLVVDEGSVTGFTGPCLLSPLNRDLCLSLSVFLSSFPIWSPISS